MSLKNPAVVKLPAAVGDLVGVADYLARTTSLAVADRFLAAAEATCKRLARMPGIGLRWEDEDPALIDVRSFPIAKFKKFLIFYRPVAGGIEVLRVIHGARETRRLFGADEED